MVDRIGAELVRTDYYPFQIVKYKGTRVEGDRSIGGKASCLTYLWTKEESRIAAVRRAAKPSHGDRILAKAKSARSRMVTQKQMSKAFVWEGDGSVPSLATKCEPWRSTYEPLSSQATFTHDIMYR